MLEQTERISFRISSVLSKVEPEPDSPLHCKNHIFMSYIYGFLHFLCRKCFFVKTNCCRVPVPVLYINSDPGGSESVSKYLNYRPFSRHILVSVSVPVPVHCTSTCWYPVLLKLILHIGSQEDPPAGVSGAPGENNILLWNAVIFGPHDTPFEVQYFYLVNFTWHTRTSKQWPGIKY